MINITFARNSIFSKAKNKNHLVCLYVFSGCLVRKKRRKYFNLFFFSLHFGESRVIGKTGSQACILCLFPISCSLISSFSPDPLHTVSSKNTKVTQASYDKDNNGDYSGQ